MGNIMESPIYFLWMIWSYFQESSIYNWECNITITKKDLRTTNWRVSYTLIFDSSLWRTQKVFKTFVMRQSSLPRARNQVDINEHTVVGLKLEYPEVFTRTLLLVKNYCRNGESVATKLQLFSCKIRVSTFNYYRTHTINRPSVGLLVPLFRTWSAELCRALEVCWR